MTLLPPTRRDFLRWSGGVLIGGSIPVGTVDRRLARCTPPARELRAVWLSLFDPLDLLADSNKPEHGPSPAGVRQLLDLLAATGVNCAIVMVDTWYAYSVVHPGYEPSTPWAKWDALGEILRGAEDRGITVHLSFPLVNKRMYPQGPGRTPPDFSLDCGGDPGWRASFLDDMGRIAQSSDNVCLSRVATREWQATLLQEFLARYPTVSRLQLEEPGYDTPAFCVCPECRRLFQERTGGELVKQVTPEAGEDATSPITGRDAAALKCEHTTALLRRLRATDPHHRISWSATISGDPIGDRALGRDWPTWASYGWLEFVTPMIYVRESGEFRRRLKATLQALAPGCAVCAGIGVHFSGALQPAPGRRAPDVNSALAVVRQIDTAREIGRASGRVIGVALFMGELLRPAYRALGAQYLADIGTRAFHAA